jgi:Uma2 family endonuclease
MALVVLEPSIEKRLKAEREASGADRFDEVWEGVYMMAPFPNNEHQDLQFDLATAIRSALGPATSARIHAGANVSDREEDWEFNYRIPDVVVVFPGGAARDCGTHWCGGPDFCAEIASPGDRSRDKLDFYAAIGVRELLLIERKPWALELYRLGGGRLQIVGRSDLGKPDPLVSTVVPVSFRLTPGTKRPVIEVAHRDGVQRWLV